MNYKPHSQRIIQIKWILSKNICTLLGLGKIPVAPGTIASLLTILLFSGFSWMSGPALILTILVGIWAIGCYSSADTVKHDASEIVIDEVAGQLLTLCIIRYCNVEITTCILITSFISFRFFDILKPFPICYIDRNIKNSFGIMLDDLLAGLAAAILTLVTFYLK